MKGSAWRSPVCLPLNKGTQMSTFTYTIWHADGTIENRTRKVRVAEASDAVLGRTSRKARPIRSRVAQHVAARNGRNVVLAITAWDMKTKGPDDNLPAQFVDTLCCKN